MYEYSVSVEWVDRKVGPSGVVKRVKASNLHGAIGKGVRETWAGMSRQQRFDAGKNGLTAKAVRVEE